MRSDFQASVEEGLGGLAEIVQTGLLHHPGRRHRVQGGVAGCATSQVTLLRRRLFGDADV